MSSKLSTDFQISQLSSFLFWDVDSSKIDLKKNKRWLIHRVLEYGRITDWLFIIKLYGINEIVEMATTMKDIDRKTVTLLSAITNVPKEKFICYNIKQLNPLHWNF